MEAIARFPDGSLTAEAVCTCCVDVLPVDRAALCISRPSSGLETLAASDAISSNFQALQVVAGDGPAFDAIASGEPVLVYDIDSGFDRWPGFVTALGPSAPCPLFDFPLQMGAISVGVLELSRNDLSPLTSSEVTDISAVAEVVTLVLLSRSAVIDDAALRGDIWSSSVPSSAEIHQATGMVVAQLSVPPQIAYVRLRAHAFATERPLHEVARAVIGRQLRFDPEIGE